MQKKTRSSRSRSKLRDLFWFSIAVCLAGAVLNSFLFYKSFFRALTKLNEEPIATITFKYKVAQRKFIDRVVWDRLRQSSPVYNGDTIHTQNLSEATIWFTDGNVMELDENTMAQVFLSKKDGVVGANLKQGSATVDSTSSESDFTISTYGVNAVVSAGSEVSATASYQYGETDKKTDSVDEEISDEQQLAAKIEKKSAERAKNKLAAEMSDEALKIGKSGKKNKDGKIVVPSTSVSLRVVSGNASVNTDDGKASVIESGESVDVNEEGKEIAIPIIIVSKPAPNSKILYFTDDKTSVHFAWTGKNLPENGNLILQIATDREFNNVIQRETVTGLSEYDVLLSEGSYYWKLKTETASFFGEKSTEAVAIGRISVNQSFAPELVTPVKDYEYTYRHRKPSIRFIWREVKYATSYQLLIATDSELNDVVLNQRSATNSSIISSLGAGVYYWKVTPFYTINKIGLASPSKVSKFVISQKGELEVPELYLPSENGIVDTEASGKGLNFSWRTDPEALSYTLKVSERPDLSGAKITETTSNNYFSLSSSELSRRNLKEGKWYWGVCLTDDEGNSSAYSSSRTFYAMKGQPAQHTIEPFEGYQVAESLSRDMLYTWKRNLPETFETRLQISKTEDFRSCVYNSVVTNNKLKGISLSIGTYFWRLVSYNSIDDSTLMTMAKSFKVVGNLEAPELVAPLGRAIARDTVPYEFKWKEVEGADYYKFSIYKNSNDDLVYEDTAYEPSLSVDLYNDKWLDKGIYYYQIQAQAIAVPGVSSRRNGSLSKNVFQLIKLRPVEIVSPKKGTVIDGLSAVMNPPSATWISVDAVKEAQFTVQRKDTNEVVIKIPSDDQMKTSKKIAPKTVVMNPEGDFGLRPGDYEIIVYAKTLDDIDISNTDAKYRGTFKVTSISPLAAPETLSVKPELFNRDYIISSKSNAITFSWAKVKGATDYFIKIYDKRNNVVLRENVSGNSYVIDYSKLNAANGDSLKKGTFTWTVEAVRRIDTDKDGKLDKVLQEGIAGNSTFTTDVPSPKASTTKGAKNPYGKK